MPDRDEVLRRLTLGDQAFLDALVSDRQTRPRTGHIDHRGEALVRLGALVVGGGSSLTWHRTVADALDAGLTPDEIVDALVALAPTVGSSRIAAITPEIASALGYDVHADLEALPARTARRS